MNFKRVDLNIHGGTEYGGDDVENIQIPKETLIRAPGVLTPCPMSQA